MNKLSKKDFEEIKKWMYMNARPLELALWKYHFENGSKEDVLNILKLYQNEDGGFGNRLELDNWNPESLPYATEHAIRMLRDMGFVDVNHPIYKGIFIYLENTPYYDEYGYYFTVPSNDNYPHAIWWSYSSEANKTQNIGTTIFFYGFILRFCNNKGLYVRALEESKKMIKQFVNGNDDNGDMGLLGFCSFYEDVKDLKVFTNEELESLKDKTISLINKEFSTYKWSFHQDFAGVLPNPNVYYNINREKEISDSIDELISIRPVNGVWGIPWNWYDNGKYTKEFGISENWWKAYKVVEKLLFLKAYDAIEE